MEILFCFKSFKCLFKMNLNCFLVCFLIFGSVCPSSVPSSTYFMDSKLALKKRSSRSPFLPPTVTSFQLPKRSVRPHTNNDLTVASAEHALMPPIIQSRSSSSFPIPKETTVAQTVPRRTSKTYFFPSHPMMAFEETPSARSEAPVDQTERAAEETTAVLLQNDEYSLKETKDSNKEHKGRLFDNDSRLINKLSNERDGSVYESLNHQKKLSTLCRITRGFSNCPPLKFADYQQVLAAINKTNEQLQIVLQTKQISVNDFLNFIERGATKEDILEFISKPERNKDINQHLYSNLDQDVIVNGNNNISELKDDSSNERQRTLTDLPFTEIVHEIPVGRRKPPEATFHFEDKYSSVDRYGKKLNGNKNVPLNKSKNYKEVNADEFKKFSKHGKNYFKNKPPQKEENYDFDFNATLFLPPKDSPIITAFLPPNKEKDTKNKNSASIVAMSVEEQKDDFFSKLNPTHERSRMIPEPDIKNKILYDHEPESKSLSSNSFSSSGNRRSPNHISATYGGVSDFSYSQQQSKLKLVLPMKGILFLCGILAIVAFITTIILIMYGVIKYNRKPRNNNNNNNCQPGNTQEETSS